LSAALVLLAAGPARSNPALYQQALRSTGWVVVPQSGGMSCGTCWVADGERRLVVTCRHVVGDAREVLVYFPRFEEDRPVVEAIRYLRESSAVTGRVIAADPVRDLAVVHLASLPAGVKAMPLADRGCGPGDDVHSIGNSGISGGLGEGTLWWYTRGSVRQVHSRKVKSDEGARTVWLVETQAPVNEGDSGGPVVDRKGRLVGVTDSYSSSQRLVSQNIDVREVRAFLKEATAPDRKRRMVSGPSPVGRWTFEVGEGESRLGKGEFRRDGRFVLFRAGKPLQGRYAYANGMLWLILDMGLVKARPAWHDKDRFILHLGDDEIQFVRSIQRKGTGSRSTAMEVSRRAGLGLPRTRARRPSTALDARWRGAPLPPIRSRWAGPQE
jgi:hypothetical protein